MLMAFLQTMTKRDIQNSMRQMAGADFVTISDISRCLGKSREYVRTQITAGLEYIGSDSETCRSKRYFVGDVADRIMQIKRC